MDLIILPERAKEKEQREGEDVTTPKGGTELMYNSLRRELEIVAPGLFDEFQFVVSRDRGLSKDKPIIYWCHDLAQDPEVKQLAEPDYRKVIDKFIMVSNWQMSMYATLLGLPYNESMVIKNAITPIEDHEKPSDGKLRLIYTSTPHRGLNILYSVVDELSKHRDDFELHVHSSYSIYGWDEKQEKFEESDFYKKLTNHPNIVFHGYTPNDEVRESLKQAHIFTYPSIYQETYCLAMVEAMSAGCIPLVPNFGALPEIGSHYTYSYQWSEDPSHHANIFYNLLNGVMNHYWDESVQNTATMAKNYVRYEHSWERRIGDWKAILEIIGKEYHGDDWSYN